MKRQRSAQRLPLGETRDEVMRRDDFRCRYCGFAPAIHGDLRGLEIDHVYPYIYGGSDEAVNLVAACARCNRIAKDNILPDFEAKRIFILRRMAKQGWKIAEDVAHKFSGITPHGYVVFGGVDGAKGFGRRRQKDVGRHKAGVRSTSSGSGGDSTVERLDSQEALGGTSETGEVREGINGGNCATSNRRFYPNEEEWLEESKVALAGCVAVEYCHRLKAKLALRGQTISEWMREMVQRELAESRKGES